MGFFDKVKDLGGGVVNFGTAGAYDPRDGGGWLTGDNFFESFGSAGMDGLGFGTGGAFVPGSTEGWLEGSFGDQIAHTGTFGAWDPSDNKGWLEGGNIPGNLLDAYTYGIYQQGDQEGIGEQLVNGAGDLIDGAGNLINGLTEGDAQSEAFNKIWPYKQNMLDAARTQFESGDTLNPDFSNQTKNYLTGLQNRAKSGNYTLNRAEKELGGLFNSSDPSADFYRDLTSGRIGGNDPARDFFNNYNYQNPGELDYKNLALGFGAKDPALQDYNNISNRVGNNPVNQIVQNQINKNNPTNQFAQNAMGADYNSLNPSTSFANNAMTKDFNASNPSTQFYGKNLGLLSGNKAFDQLGRTASGEYLNNNPYLDSTFDRASSKLSDAYSDAVDAKNSNFSLAGRYGSGAHQAALAKQQEGLGEALGGLANDIYGGNYQSERDRMVSALNPLGSFSDSAMSRVMGGVDRLGSNYNQGIDRNFQGANMASNNFGQGLDRQFQGANMLSNNYMGDTGNTYQGANILGNQYNTDTSTMGNVASGRSNIFNTGIDRQIYGMDKRADLYDKGQGFNMDAMRTASNIYDTGINRRAQGAAGQSGVYNSDFGNSLSLMNPAFNFANQDYVDLDRLGQAGGMYDDLNFRKANEQWQNINNYNAAIGGLPAQQPGQSWLEKASQLATVATPFFMGGK